MLRELEIKKELNSLVNDLVIKLQQTDYREITKNFKKEYEQLSEKEKIHIVLAGEWSTGKSSIASALTGENDIQIDADVKTSQSTIYDYKDICIVDTPGLLSGFDDHTKITVKEVQNADRILFVISTELFTENSKKEFYEIIKNADVLDRTILVINKIDSVRPDIAIDLVDNVLDEIDDDGVVDSDNIDIVSMSAKLYLDGMRDNAEDMIEDSNIDALEKLLSNTKTEQYPLKRKCCQQIRLFDEFIAQIKNTEDSKLSDDQRRKIADNREKIRQEIKATKLACTEIIKNGLGECQNSLSGTIHDFIRDKNTTEMNDSVNRIYNDSVNNIREDINLQFNGLLQKCNMEFRNIEHINDIFKPFTEEMPQSVDSNSNHSNFSEEIKEMLFKGSEKINQLAKPVVVGEKKHWFKKNEKILSPKGGEGTALNKIIGKVPILKKMNNVAPGLAAVAESVEKHQIAINVGFIFVDIAKDIKESYDKASTEKKRKRIIDQANRKFDDVINGQKYRLMDIVRKQADALENNLDKILPQESDNPVAQIINEAEKSLDQIQDRMEKID